ncbi:unnamed protein product, partial [Polarella glacialis]
QTMGSSNLQSILPNARSIQARSPEQPAVFFDPSTKLADPHLNGVHLSAPGYRQPSAKWLMDAHLDARNLAAACICVLGLLLAPLLDGEPGRLWRLCLLLFLGVGTAAFTLCRAHVSETSNILEQVCNLALAIAANVVCALL